MKAQNSMEFVILTSFMMFVFAMFFIIIQQKTIAATEEKNDATAQQLLDIATSEIKLAESVSDDYYRQFTMPNNLNGLQYNISIIPGVAGTSEIVVKYSNKEKVLFLEAYISSGSTMGSGPNNITKADGVITVKYVG